MTDKSLQRLKKYHINPCNSLITYSQCHQETMVVFSNLKSIHSADLEILAKFFVTGDPDYKCKIM